MDLDERQESVNSALLVTDYRVTPAAHASHVLISTPRETVRKAILSPHQPSPGMHVPLHQDQMGNLSTHSKVESALRPMGPVAAAGWGRCLQSLLVQKKKKGRHTAVTGSKSWIPARRSLGRRLPMESRFLD